MLGIHYTPNSIQMFTNIQMILQRSTSVMNSANIHKQVGCTIKHLRNIKLPNSKPNYNRMKVTN